MALPHPTEARFPSAPLKAGQYESFYVKACHPSEPLGVWIRHTTHKRPREQPKGSLWFVLFDAAAEGPRASKVTLPGPAAGDGDWIRAGEGSLGPGRVAGSAPSERSEPTWDLRFESSEEALYHLPREWMYGAPIPRTKTLSPYPAARYDGRLTVDGREIEVSGWPGMVGHNWGAEHAERWIWLHGLGFDGHGDDTWLDVSLGRVKLGPLTTPWVAVGAISIAGERHPLGGLERARRTEVRESPERCEFTLPGKGVSVRGSVSAPKKDFVGWVYADPGGGEHNTVNCSIADMELEVSRDRSAPLSLRVAGGAAYELGMRETDHGVPIQPFPDG